MITVFDGRMLLKISRLDVVLPSWWAVKLIWCKTGYVTKRQSAAEALQPQHTNTLQLYNHL